PITSRDTPLLALHSFPTRRSSDVVLVIVTYRPSDLALHGHAFGPVKLDLQARGVSRAVALTALGRADLDRYLSLAFPGHDFTERSEEHTLYSSHVASSYAVFCLNK